MSPPFQIFFYFCFTANIKGARGKTRLSVLHTRNDKQPTPTTWPHLYSQSDECNFSSSWMMVRGMNEYVITLIRDNITFTPTDIPSTINTHNIELQMVKVHLTLSDPGYFRQLTIRVGALKAPPYDLKNYCVNLHHIIHVNFTRCFWHDPIGIFQKFAILTILQRFQNKK